MGKMTIQLEEGIVGISKVHCLNRPLAASMASILSVKRKLFIVYKSNEPLCLSGYYQINVQHEPVYQMAVGLAVDVYSK